MFGRHWKPQIRAYAYAEDEAVAPRDGGWVELWSTDGERRYGRGHLMLWPAETATGGSAVAELDKDAAQPVGEGAPNLRAELRGFTFDGNPPDIGADLMVRPEKEQDSYAVRVTDVETEEPNGRVGIDWPDDRLPAALSELGGH
ncbi:MAG: hypothetical protein M0R75_11465 [Dehalococcoidia bacterium]|nr:hypothetical protein [Dehalococcoidia bacterium]